MFKVGQKVLCLSSFGWANVQTCASDVGPAKWDILEISEVDHYKSETYLSFTKYPDKAYFHKHFRPLDYVFVEEVIKQVQPEKQPA